MSIKSQLFGLFTVTLLALGIFLAIFLNSDPNVADIFTKTAFFVSIFLFTGGFLTFLGFYLRIYFSNREVIYNNLPIAFRQAVLISFLLTGLLALQSLRVLSIWDAIIFVVVVILIELYFRSRK